AVSPSARSILITRAPPSASLRVQTGAATACSMATTSSPSSAPMRSIRPRHAEHMLGEIAQDQVGRDRRHLIQPCLAEFALDIKFLGKAETAMGLHAGFGGGPGSFRRQHLRHIGLGAAIGAGLE